LKFQREILLKNGWKEIAEVSPLFDFIPEDDW